MTEAQSLHNAQLVANHFAGRWTSQAISAMLGNMRVESSVNPNMYEFGYDWEEDRGFGLVQWTPRSKYWDWAVNNNLPPREGESQLARIDYEVENDIQWIPLAEYDNMTFEQFTLSTQHVEYLTEVFTWSYERPRRDAGEQTMHTRKAFAVLCFQELDFDGDTPGTPGDPGDQEQTPYFVIRRHSTNMRRMGIRGRR